MIAARTVEPISLARRLAAEFIGTAFLLATVVGSGIMAESLSAGNAGVALLANAIATGGGLVALILTFGPISGAHFNPIVTASDAALGRFAWRDVPAYWMSQVLGAMAGVALAHVMFEKPIYFASTHVRAGTSQFVSEATAAFGLLVVIWGCARSRPSATPFAVAAYITAAYWFTSSTSKLVPSCPASSGRTGPCPTRRACPSKRSARFATKSSVVSKS